MTEGLGFGRRRLIEKIILNNWKVNEPNEKKFNYNELLFVIQEMLVEEGRPYHEGKKSGEHHKIFKAFVKHLLYRNLANYDSMLLLSSEKGTGKSSAAIVLAREWCKLLGIKFNPKRHIAYTNADVMNKIEKLKAFEPLICVGGRSRIRIKIEGKEHSVKIEELVGKNNFEVLTYNKEKDIFEYQKPKEVILTKKDLTYEIELENGVKIEATKNHLFLTKERGYKRLDELNEKDELVLQSKKCIICGKEYFKKQWDAKTCSKECSKKQCSIPYRIKYPERARLSNKKKHNYKFKTNIIYRIKHNLMTRIFPYIRGIKTPEGNKSRFVYWIGCSEKQFKKYLENQFKDIMSWENYGKYWSIDHIIPLKKINKYNRHKLLHYTNIQPLLVRANSGKGRWIE